MIHPVQLPEETEVYLRQIVDLQIGILECVVDLSPNFCLSDLQASLAKRREFKDRAEVVAKWIETHPSIRKSLQAFAEDPVPIEDKRKLAEQMRRDIQRLYQGYCDETLEYHFPQTQPIADYERAAREFLLAFYEQLQRGFDKSLFTENPAKYDRFGRQQFLAACRDSWPRVCVICDTHLPTEIVRGEHSSSIEHYFPKSIYPHLSCHPYNLLPICSQCNQAHSDRDPLAAPNGARRTLSEVFLPYRGETVRQAGGIKLDWREPSSCPKIEQSKSIPAFVLAPKLDDDTFPKRCEVLSVLYDIPCRWQHDMHIIGSTLWRRIKHFFHAADTSLDRLIKEKHFFHVADTSLDRPIKEIEELQKLLTEVGLDSSEFFRKMVKLLEYSLADLGKEPHGCMIAWSLAYYVVKLERENSVNPRPPGQHISEHEEVEEILQTARVWYS